MQAFTFRLQGINKLQIDSAEDFLINISTVSISSIMEMKKIACAVLFAAASASAVMAQEAPAPAPAASAASISLPAVGSLIGASLAPLAALYLQ
ncbi:arabinogalactan protein 23-like [Euphorbia lathyris]|uniref:arabinogalactan protein 23-like n=1 Tax=Euphorbia lathyris TaxID=212925 RepID=UPI003313F32D